MIVLNDQTKIGAILKDKPETLEAIISISPHFNKLRNPVLRKLIASRATIKMASQIGGCSVNDFFEKLRPFGFTVDTTTDSSPQLPTELRSPFVRDLDADKIMELDVRPVIEAGKDPFALIMGKLTQLAPGHIFKLVNSFEPIPLIDLLTKKGFEYHVEHIDENCVVTYFDKKSNEDFVVETQPTENADWDELLHFFGKRIRHTNVRQMEMPLPMHTILEELDGLPDDHALFVYHKRVPVFLLPGLKERRLEYRIREISDTEVHLLIFKKQV